MTRLPLIVANWKMNTSLADAYLLANGVRNALHHLEHTEMVLCPPSVWLGLLAEHSVPPRQYSTLKLGAQNMHAAPAGSYTGEISPAMVREVAEYVIVGHSERVRYGRETVEQSNAKLHAALAHGLTPILCVGEPRKSKDSVRQVVQHLGHLVKGLSNAELREVVVAYEPVWAIGTGDPATPEYAQEVAWVLKQHLPAETRLLYGGSVEPGIAAGFLASPQIDGLLVGGASVNLKKFLTICQHADDTVVSARTATYRHPR
jgi:triosephosphate isomerase